MTVKLKQKISPKITLKKERREYYWQVNIARILAVARGTSGAKVARYYKREPCVLTKRTAARDSRKITVTVAKQKPNTKK
ncbi:hypothetical protein MTR_4g071340 [Medicago truncatula]|uniref:Uncharacterized protein n=1 Tax=Medicago truncatula TaxID=3880 RepID=G7JIN9_MEDTR|nr:hypothetical protein MTR_4g071340 [Medicago truncatula]